MKKFVTYMDAVKNKSNILETVFLNPFKSVLGEFSKFQSMIEQSIDLDKANQGEFIVNPKFSSVLLELDRELNKIRS
jgi:DNA mismatch repair protein MSH2